MRRAGLCLLLVLLVPSWAEAYETLQMVRPIATGVAGTGLDSHNRVYRAYQGITYTIHADARGGHWPYTYRLSNAPTGMTISAGPCSGDTLVTCTAGEITWTNPQATASDVVVTVRDADGNEVSGTWSVTVSITAPGTDGFCFIDSALGNDTTGSGTLASPWATLGKAKTDCGQYSILYLRTGTYTTPTVAADGNCGGGGRATWREDVTDSNRGPVIWIGYPSETVTVDWRSDGGTVTPCILLQGSNVWVENFRMDNVGSIGFQLGRNSQYGVVIRHITGVELLDAEDSDNSGYFMWPIQTDIQSYFDTVQLSSFDNIHGDGAGSDGGCALKVYSVEDGIFETTSFLNTGPANAFTEAMLALKNIIPHWTVRANYCDANVKTCIGGNMNNNDTGSNRTNGEVYHNLCLGSGATDIEGCLTLHRGADNAMGVVYVYRNTFLGKVVFEESDVSVSGSPAPSGAGAAGPYYFNDNVILNASNEGGGCPERIDCRDNTPTLSPDWTRLVMDADNVLGANDGTKANATTGVLVGTTRMASLGIAGYELASTTSSVTTSGGVRMSGGVKVY